MKAESNNENKVRFFHQYACQYVTSNKGRCYLRDADFIDEIEWIELTPLSAITDEDAIEVAKYLGMNVLSKHRNQEMLLIKGKHGAFIQFYDDFDDSYYENGATYSDWERIYLYELTDFFRSKSYAVSWMGLSVEEMIEAGWIKLKK